MATSNFESFIKQENSVDFICILPSYQPDDQTINTTLLSNIKQEKSEEGSLIKDESEKHKCKTCSAKFDDMIKLLSHLKRHSGVRRVQCPECDRFISKKNIKDHWKFHDVLKNDPKFKCQICLKPFFCRKNLKRHLSTHVRPFECDICGHRVSRLSLMTPHLERHISEWKTLLNIRGSGLRSLDLQVLKCKLCQSSYRNVKFMVKHIRNRHKGVY